MREIFEKGQAYVALSRCRSLNGIQILNFEPRKVRADETALQFYHNLAQSELDDEEINSIALFGRSYSRISNSMAPSDNHDERNRLKRSYHQISENSNWNNKKKYQPKRPNLDHLIETTVAQQSLEMPKNQKSDALANTTFALIFRFILNNAQN